MNAVCPNDVDTPTLAGQAKNYGGGDPDGYLAALLANYPQKGRAQRRNLLGLDEPSVDFGSTAGY